jgi:asparagine synthase (glutamine-hydrolysing)
MTVILKETSIEESDEAKSGIFIDSPLYAADMLSEASVKKAGYFDAAKVQRLAAKCETNAGQLLSERENMALAGILSTQLLHRQFIEEFPTSPPLQPREVKVFE